MKDFPFRAFLTYKKQEIDSENLVDIFDGAKGDKEGLVKTTRGLWSEVSEIFAKL